MPKLISEPSARLRRVLQLHLESLQPGDPLLDGRMRRDDRPERALRARGDDEERVQLPYGAQVAVRYAHPPAAYMSTTSSTAATTAHVVNWPPAP